MAERHDQATPLRTAGDSAEAAYKDLAGEIASLDGVAEWMDSKFSLPGTKIRFGLDGIFGLIPGVGDTLTAIPAGHIILTAVRLGAPKHVIARMLVNLGVDTVDRKSVV